MAIRISRAYPPPAIVIRAINAASTRLSARIEIYEQDGKTRWASDKVNRLIDGSVSIDYSRDERRSLDLTLDNADNVLVSAPGYFWYDKIIKVYRQVRVRAGSYDAWEYQLGEFMIDSIDEDHFPHQVKISGRDYAKKLLLEKFTVSTQFTGTYSLEYLVQTIASNGGISKMVMPTTGLTVKDLTATRGQTRWEVIKKLASDNAYDLFFDNTGYLRLAPQPDPFLQDPVYTFKTGSVDGNLTSYSKSTDDTGLYNHVLVTGSGQDASGTGILPYAEAINTDPDSPTNVDEIGDRLYEWDSDLIAYRTNYSPNPSVESSAANYVAIAGTGGAATASRQTGGTPAPSGLAKARVAWTTATTAVSGGIGHTTLAGSFVAGDKLSASCTITTSIAQRVQIQVQWLDKAGAAIGAATAGQTIVLSAGTAWTTFTISNLTAPTNADSARLQAVAVAGTGGVNWTSGSYIEMDKALIEKATAVGAWFNGNVYGCWWTGTTNLSPSISNEQAQNLADAFLKIHALEQYSVSLNALNHFYLDVGQVIEFDDPRPAPGDPTRFLLQSLTIPIKLGVMSGQAGRVLNVGGG